MEAPRVVLISAVDLVDEDELCARLAAAASLPLAARRRLAVQLRDPGLSGRALLALGARLRAATAAVGASLVVNDRLDLARALGADGAQLGRLSVSVADARAFLGKDAWIGRSCHALADVERAAAEGADAAVLSPIFASPGKGTPLGLEALRAARALLGDRGSPALIALGGVDAASARACLAAGADGVAAIRADLVEVAAILQLDAPASPR